MFLFLLVVILFVPHQVYAGFDFGPVGNSLFWVGLALWSALIAWVLYTRRATLGKGIFGILRTVFAPHTKTTVVLSSPKYRPYVQTSHVVDSLEEAAESFLTSAKTGFRDAKSATRYGMSILEHDAKTVLRAAELQAHTLRKGTTLSERVKNIKRLLSGKRASQKIARPSIVQKVSRHNEPVPTATPVALTSHDESHHTRHKVKILSDAHRALIRARNAQHDLPEGGQMREVDEIGKVADVQIPVMQSPAPAPAIAVPKSIPTVEHIQPQQKVVQDVVSKPVPRNSEAQHVTQREHPKKEVEYPTVHHASAATIAATGPTKDELVLDTSGPIPRLVLTRKAP